MTSGIVHWFNDAKGYGFIKADEDDRDIFVHFADIEGPGFKTLVEDQRVTFEVIDNGKGPQAKKVTKVEA